MKVEHQQQIAVKSKETLFKTETVKQISTEKVATDITQVETIQKTIKTFTPHDTFHDQSEEIVKDFEVIKPTQEKSLFANIPVEGAQPEAMSTTLLFQDDRKPAHADIRVLPRQHISSEETIPAEKEMDKSFVSKTVKEVASTKISDTNRSVQVAETTYEETTENLEKLKTDQQKAQSNDTRLLDHLIVQEPLVENSTDDISLEKLPKGTAIPNIVPLQGQDKFQQTPVEKEAQLKEAQREQIAHGIEQMVLAEGIEVEETMKNESEQSLVSKQKDKPVTPKYTVPYHEPLEISEAITNDKPTKYYPELIVPTEMATKSILEHKTYITELVNAEHKENTFTAEKIPGEQLAELNIKENIAIDQQEIPSYVAEDAFKSKPRLQEENAQDSIVLSEGLILSSADVQAPSAEFDSQPDRKPEQAAVYVEKQEHILSSVAIADELLENLPQSENPPLKSATPNILGLQLSQIQETIINENEGIFEENLASASRKVQTVIYPIQPSVQEETQPLSTVEEKEFSQSVCKVQANVDFEKSEPASTEILSVHEKEEDFIPQLIKPEERISPKTEQEIQKSITVSQISTSEKEAPLSVDKLPIEQRAHLMANDTQYRVAEIAETQPGDTTGPLADQEKVTALAAPDVSLAEPKLISQQILLEKENEFISSQTPVGQRPKAITDERLSLEVSQTIPQESERDFEKPVVPSQSAKQALPNALKSALVQEVQPTSTTGTQPAEKTEVKEAVIGFEELTQKNIEEVFTIEGTEDTSVLPQPTTCKAETKPELMTPVLVSVADTVEKVSDMKQDTQPDMANVKSTLQEALQASIISEMKSSESIKSLPYSEQPGNIAARSQDRSSAVSVLEITPLETSDDYSQHVMPDLQSTKPSVGDHNQSVQVLMEVATEHEGQFTETKVDSFTASIKLGDAMRAANIEEVKPLLTTNVLDVTEPNLIKPSVQQDLFDAAVTEESYYLEQEHPLTAKQEQEIKTAQSCIDSTEASVVLANQALEAEGELIIPATTMGETTAAERQPHALKSALIDEVAVNTAPGTIGPEKYATTQITPKVTLLQETDITQPIAYEKSDTFDKEDSPVRKQATGTFETPGFLVTSENTIVEKELDLQIQKFAEAQTTQRQTDIDMKVPLIEEHDTALCVSQYSDDLPEKGQAYPLVTELTGKVVSEICTFDNVQPSKDQQKPLTSQANQQFETREHLTTYKNEITEHEEIFHTPTVKEGLAAESTDTYLKSVTTGEIVTLDSIDEIDIKRPVPNTASSKIDQECTQTSVHEVLLYDHTQPLTVSKFDSKNAQVGVEGTTTLPEVTATDIFFHEQQMPDKIEKNVQATLTTDFHEPIESSEVIPFNQAPSAEYELSKVSAQATSSPSSCKLATTGEVVTAFEPMESFESSLAADKKATILVGETNEALITTAAQIAESEKEIMEKLPNTESVSPNETMKDRKVAIVDQICAVENADTLDITAHKEEKGKVDATKLQETIIHEQTPWENLGSLSTIPSNEGQNVEAQLQLFKNVVKTTELQAAYKEEMLVTSGVKTTDQAVVNLTGAQSAHETQDIVPNESVSNLGSSDKKPTTAVSTISPLESLQVTDAQVCENLGPAADLKYDEQQRTISLDSIQLPIINETTVHGEAYEGIAEQPSMRITQAKQSILENVSSIVSETVLLDQIGHTSTSSQIEETYATKTIDAMHALEEVAHMAEEMPKDFQDISTTLKQEPTEQMQSPHTVATKQTTFANESEKSLPPTRLTEHFPKGTYQTTLPLTVTEAEFYDSETKTEVPQTVSSTKAEVTRDFFTVSATEHTPVFDHFKDLSLKSTNYLKANEQLQSALLTVSETIEKVYQDSGKYIEIILISQPKIMAYSFLPNFTTVTVLLSLETTHRNHISEYYPKTLDTQHSTHYHLKLSHAQIHNRTRHKTQHNT